MKTIRFAPAAFLFVALLASAAMAQQRTFVSGLGNDANPCTRTAPCRTFAIALGLTNPGGEVIALDSAGYGTMAGVNTIVKSISIIAPPGVYAGISVSSGDGIDIGSSGTVVLRGLTINNSGSSGHGILYSGSGGTLHIEDCVVNGFAPSGDGLFFAGPGKLEVKDSIMRDNFVGIQITPSSTTASATIDHVRFETNTGQGLLATDLSKVTVSNSVASGNSTGFGAVAFTQSCELTLESCVASNNGAGITAQSNAAGVATVRFSNCTITDNSTGLDNLGSPAVILSRSNNTVEGNATATVGPIGTYAAQ